MSDTHKQLIIRQSKYPPASTTKIRVTVSDVNISITTRFLLTLEYSKIALESVSHENTISGNECEITIVGSGFDESTQAIIVPVEENIIIGKYKAPGLFRGLSVSGKKAFLADEYNGLHVIDISNPYKPKIVCYIQTPGIACDVEVIDELAYVADWVGGVIIIDIHDLFKPNIIGTYEMEGAYSIAKFDQTAYVNSIASDIIEIINISNPDQPEFIDKIDLKKDLSEYIYDIDVADNILFISNGTDLKIFNINDYSRPELISSFEGAGYGISVVDNIAYGSYLQIIDISDLKYPISIKSNNYSKGYKIEVLNNIAYLLWDDFSIIPILDVNTFGQIQNINTSDTNLIVNLKASLSPGKYQLKVFNHQHEDTIEFMVRNHDIFDAIPDQTIYGNTDIFSIPFTINETNPVLTAQDYSINVVSSNQEIISNNNINLDLLHVPKIINIKPFYNQFGRTQLHLIISNDNGLFASEQFELSIEFPQIMLENRQEEVSDYYYLGDDIVIDIDGIGFDENTQVMLIPVQNNNNVYSFFDYSYGITAANKTIYSRGLNNELQILDMSHFLNHKSVGVNDKSVKGRGITVIDNLAYITNDGFQIINVSDYSKPEQIANIDTPGTANDVTVLDGTAYVADSQGLQVIDVSNSFKPEKQGFINTKDNASYIQIS
jgi:hypothetical protein